jgi:serine/threonine protein kinase
MNSTPCYSLKDFQIESVIGIGAYSKVFLVKNTITNGPYALKIIKKKNIKSQRQIEMIS